MSSAHPSSSTTIPSAPLGSTSGSSKVAKSYDPPAVNESNPVSSVADHAYPNVPDNIGGQEAATAPGSGGGASIKQVDEHHIEQGTFKQQVGGYAKKIAGTVFGNEDEKKLGEAKLRGDAP